jgi:hypothetical protein
MSTKTNTKQLTAQELFDFLKDLEEQGLDLNKIDVNYRHDYDSDVEEVRNVDEDLYDEVDNSTLTSICLVTEPTKE